MTKQVMPDLEKVIVGLERCKLYNKLNCDKCPYDYNGRWTGKSECTSELATDALVLLKEREGRWISVPHKKARICSRCYADEPYKFADEDADVYDYCPNCGARMINRR